MCHFKTLWRPAGSDLGNRVKERVKSRCFTCILLSQCHVTGHWHDNSDGQSRSVSLLKHFTDTHYQTQMVSMEMIRKAGVKQSWRWNLPQKLSPRWAHLHQPARQPLSLHHGWQGCQLVSLDQTARDTCWRSALARWDYDAHAIVATSSHGTATGVHHEAHQKPVEGKWSNKRR